MEAQEGAQAMDRKLDSVALGLALLVGVFALGIWARIVWLMVAP